MYFLTHYPAVANFGTLAVRVPMLLMNDIFKFSGLNERAQHLLKVLVERYISDGQPVGSRALSREAGLSLSPATIRNIMADLEDLGLITAPHTSAGRMPTVSGYRFFIDSLLTVKPLQQEVIRQFKRGLEPLDEPGKFWKPHPSCFPT